MSKVQLPGSKTFDSQILMYSCTHKNDVSLAKQFENICLRITFDKVKYRKRASKIKWTDREYHVQYNADVAHKDVKMYCDTNELS